MLVVVSVLEQLIPFMLLMLQGDVGFNEYIYHNGDADTYIRFAPDLVNVVAGGWSAIKLDKSSGKIQLNNGNQDLDVQVMADDGEVILHTDAATNRVGIGTDAPTTALDIHHNPTGLSNDTGGGDVVTFGAEARVAEALAAGKLYVSCRRRAMEVDQMQMRSATGGAHNY